MTGREAPPIVRPSKRAENMAEESKDPIWCGWRWARAFLPPAPSPWRCSCRAGAGSQAAAPFRAAMELPVAAAMTAWATGLWDDMTTPTPPMFDDMRPFDEF